MSEVRDTSRSTSLDLGAADPPLVIVVGSGGMGKTTLAAAMGVESACSGLDTLVMTFDPSLRLQDALGVDRAAEDDEVEIPLADVSLDGRRDGDAGVLRASLLDAGKTFDRLVERYAPDEEARDRILGNRYYRHMAGHLGGILEYMAVERLYEVASEGRYDRIFLDTPPTTQAIDFLEAPQRIVDFLDSGVLKIALKPWFDEEGGLKVSKGLGFFSRGLERFLDRIVGMQLLRDMSEFFRAFEPLFDGFRRRAEKVRGLLEDRGTIFVLVTGPGEAGIPDTLFFARRLRDAGHRLGPLVVNRVHPRFDVTTDDVTAEEITTEDVSPQKVGDGDLGAGVELFRWLGENHRRGIEELRRLLPDGQVVAEMPLEADEPTDLRALARIGGELHSSLDPASDRSGEDP